MISELYIPYYILLKIYNLRINYTCLFWKIVISRYIIIKVKAVLETKPRKRTRKKVF